MRNSFQLEIINNGFLCENKLSKKLSESLTHALRGQQSNFALSNHEVSNQDLLYCYPSTKW